MTITMSLIQIINTSGLNTVLCEALLLYLDSFKHNTLNSVRQETFCPHSRFLLIRMLDIFLIGILYCILSTAMFKLNNLRRPQCVRLLRQAISHIT